MKYSILIVDDDDQYMDELIFLLGHENKFQLAGNSISALQKFKEFHPDVILLDLMLGDENGIDLLKQIKSIDIDVPVIMITEYASVETAVEAMRLGADDYVSKTTSLSELKFLIERSIHRKIEKLKTKTLKEEIHKNFQDIVGDSDEVKDINYKIELIAQNSNTVLITGESGTGKELIARNIHELSDRKNELFVAINCGALPEHLIESELFGHEQGAFTGAIKKKLGKFEISSKGTIFLDEIAELKLEAQVKLMRVLQEKEFERLGGNNTIKTDARIIAATNKPLEKLVEQGKFREDLFYRLDVFPIYAAPLRDRKGDIILLVDYFMPQISRELNLPNPSIDPAVLEIFNEYSWPGNVRELINLLTRFVILSKGNKISEEIIDCKQLKKRDSGTKNISLNWNDMDKMRREAASEASRRIEFSFAQKLLEKFNGNVSSAAKHAGIDRTNLHRIIKRCGL